MLTRIARSVEYRFERRLRRYLDKRESDRLHSLHSIRIDHDVPIDVLRIARTIKAHRPIIRRLIDVGANVGSFTNAISKIWTLNEIVCIEPNQDLAPILRKSVPPASKIIHSAVGAVEGEARLYLHPNSSMNSLIPVNEQQFDEQWGYYKAAAIGSRPVKVQHLDSLLCLLDDTTSRDILLKIDAQGAEMDILRSGSSVLRLSSVCLVECMFWSGYAKMYDLADLVEFMSQQGFRCTGALEPHYREDGRAAYADFLFVPEATNTSPDAYKT